MSSLVVLSNEKGFNLARRTAYLLNAEFAVVEQKTFPDGELYLRIPLDVRGKIVVPVWSIKEEINNDLISLMLVLDTLWDLGAKKVISVVPYMPYARQDSRFKDGEALSIVTIAKLLRAVHSDYVVTVDMHLHRIGDPRFVFGEKIINVSGVDAIADYIKNRHPQLGGKAIVVGPDEESEQWASRLGMLLGLKWVVLEKERYSAEEVEVKLRESMPREAEKAIIIDDIISTGGTIESTVNLIRKLGLNEIYVYCTHPVLSASGLYKIASLGLADYACTNTLPSPISTIDVSGVLASSIKSLA